MFGVKKPLLLSLAILVLVGRTASGQNLPHGVIVDDVQCTEDAAQHYALYLPSNFTPSRRWPVILGFDAGGRGRRAVERYQEAAEKYGYIVVGSNNSRNGPWEPILEAASAMRRDVENRFPIDPKRRYAAGMSGGARVSMALALKSTDIAGVLASSAGFPDEGFQESVRFPIFGTMGTEDFNYDEMHLLDKELKSPHRLEMFDGGHQWPPVELATDGVEWMEIQAMKRGERPRDQHEVDQLFAKRMTQADALKSDLAKMRELKAIADDFKGLKDVVAVGQRAASLERQQNVKDELKAEGVEEQREIEGLREVFDLLDEAANNNKDAFVKLKSLVIELAQQSKAPDDSTARRFARRVLASVSAEVRSVADGDPEVLELMKQVRPPTPPQ
jgi:dienelactone hydrolase